MYFQYTSAMTSDCCVQVVPIKEEVDWENPWSKSHRKTNVHKTNLEVNQLHNARVIDVHLVQR